MQRVNIEHNFLIFQLVLSVTINGQPIPSWEAKNLFPSASSIVSLADIQNKAALKKIALI